MDIPKNIDAIEERIKQILSEAPKFAQKIIDDIKVLNPNVLQELAKAKPMQTINNVKVWGPASYRKAT